MIWWLFRKVLFLLPPEIAHEVGALGLRFLAIFYRSSQEKSAASAVKKSAQPVRFSLAGMRLDSPLGLAAGFDKNAEYLLGLRVLGFGFVEVGTVTPLPQPGNPTPRLFRLPHSRALINRMGFNSEGVDVVAARLKDLRAWHSLDFPVGVNLGKNRETPLERAADDYVKALGPLYALSDYVVVNLSSPNTPGLAGLQEKDQLLPLLQKVRSERDRLAKTAAGAVRPLFLKISPDLTEAAMAEAVQAAFGAGYEGLIATNTSRRREFPGLSARDQALFSQEGGLSGAPLRAEALERIRFLRAQMGAKGTLISVGGLGGPDDAAARLAAGANLLQVYTEFVYSGPTYPGKIAQHFQG